MKHNETINKKEEEGRRQRGREGGGGEGGKGEKGGGGVSLKETICLPFQVSPWGDLLPNSLVWLLTGFQSLEAVGIESLSSLLATG